MRLLFLSNFYPPYARGGFEELCKEVTDRLRQRGYTIRILTSRHGIQSQTEGIQDDVIRRLHLQADIYHYRPVDFFLKRPFQERANVRTLRNTINQFSPDLVVVWGMWNLSRNLPYWLEQWLPGRVAYYVSDIWPDSVDIHKQYWQRPVKHRLSGFVKRLLRPLVFLQLRREGYPPTLRFEHAVCCSEYIRDKLMRAGRVPDSTGVLYHGIEPNVFLRDPAEGSESAGGTLRLLYFGRLVAFKGVHTAIEALGLLQQRGLSKRVELTVIGSGHPDYEFHLKALAAQLEIEDHIHFTGRVPWDELLLQLKRSDVMLFTTIGPEAMARTVMEAMAAGLLVIGTQAGGQREMLFDGKNALVFQAGDAASLAGCIVRALEEPSLRYRLAKAGQQIVLERFTLKRMVDDVEEWLRAILR